MLARLASRYSYWTRRRAGWPSSRMRPSRSCLPTSAQRRRSACVSPQVMSLPNAGEPARIPDQPFRHITATVEASGEQESGAGVDYGGSGLGQRCHWCSAVHLDQWTALDPQLGQTGRQRVFVCAGKTVTLTFSQWDVRSRATAAAPAGGGLFAVDILPCSPCPALVLALSAGAMGYHSRRRRSVFSRRTVSLATRLHPT